MRDSFRCFSRYEMTKVMWNIIHEDLSKKSQYFFKLIYADLRIRWWLSTILKTSNKSLWRNVFWYVRVFIFWECIQYTIHWDEIQILKKFLSDKINHTKNAFFFLFQAPPHHSFFNLRFLYELNHTFRLSSTASGIFHF